MELREANKNLGIRHNVSFRVIDAESGRVVSTHKGHNSATNSLLTGIGHYLKGDGVLNQGWEMLSAYVPRYISLGTMGLLSQDEDADGLPSGVGDKNYFGVVYGALSDEQLEGIGKKLRVGTELTDHLDWTGPGGKPDGISDGIEGDITPDSDDPSLVEVNGTDLITPEDQELLRYIDYLTHSPGFGADGYDPNLNNGRLLEGLGPMFQDRAYGSKNLDDLVDHEVDNELIILSASNKRKYSWSHDFNIAINGNKCRVCGHAYEGKSQRFTIVFNCTLDVAGNYTLEILNLPAADLTYKGTYRTDGNRVYLAPPKSGNTKDIDSGWKVFEADFSSWWRIEDIEDGSWAPMYYYPAPTLNCELISPSFPRAQISFRDVVPEMEAEFPKTIDVIFSAMISTGALAQFREPGRDYVFITEAGLWAQKDWIGGGDNGLLAGYRIAPPNKENWDMSKPENRRILQEQIIKVKKNQVVQVIWKIQLGSIDQFEGIEALYPAENRPQWIEW